MDENIILDDPILEQCPICFEENLTYIILDCNHKICIICLTDFCKHNDKYNCWICRNKIENIKMPLQLFSEITVVQKSDDNYEINNIDPFISKQFNGNNMVFKCFSSFIFIWILINMVLLCTTILSNVSKSDLCIVNKRNWTNIWPYENSHESSKPYYYGITITNIVLPFLILFISILKCDLLKIKKYRKITDNILLLSHTFVLLWLSWLFSQTIYQIMNNMGCFLEIIIGISISLITLITFSTLFFRIINYQ